MLDRDAEFLLVTDRAGQLRGVVGPRDFAISPITVGVSLHEQLRRATSIEDLATFAGRVPPMLGDLLSRGLASGKVIAVYSALPRHDHPAGDRPGVRPAPGAVGGRLHLAVAGQQRPAGSRAQLGRRLGGRVRRRRRPRRRSWPTGPRSPRSPGCWPRPA